MATVQQLIANVKRIYPTAESDSTIVAHFNLAQDELSPYFGTIVESETLTTTAGEDSYAFPTGLEDVSQIISLDIGFEATPATRHSYKKYYQGNRDELNVGCPVYFQLISSTGAKSLGLYPIPSTTGLPIRIRFRKKLTDLLITNQSASPDFDSRFHDLLVWFACHMLAASGSSPDTIQADMFMQKYTSTLEDLWRLKMTEEKKQQNRKRDNIQWRR